MARVRIVCVLKSGGDFNGSHVEALRRQAKVYLPGGFDFVVLTDLAGVPDPAPLWFNLPGWRSKLEAFNYAHRPILYFDLDTVLCRDLGHLLTAASNMPVGEFRMLRPFNPIRNGRGEWASGIMAWHGDFRFLLYDFDQNFSMYPAAGDQEYIFRALLENGREIKSIQDWASVVSYKRHCRNGVPKDADIVCFHGKPRPWETSEEWALRWYHA